MVLYVSNIHVWNEEIKENMDGLHVTLENFKDDIDAIKILKNNHTRLADNDNLRIGKTILMEEKIYQD